MKRPFCVGEFEKSGRVKWNEHETKLFLSERYNLLVDIQKETYTILSLSLLELEDWLFCHSESVKYFPTSIIPNLQPKLIFGKGDVRVGLGSEEKNFLEINQPNIMEDYAFFATLYSERFIPPEMFYILVWRDFKKQIYIPDIETLKRIVDQHYTFKGNFVYYNTH